MSVGRGAVWVTPAHLWMTWSGDGSGETGGTGTDVQFQAALKEAQAAMTARDAALKAGDLTAFAAADAQLTAAVQKLLALSGGN